MEIQQNSNPEISLSEAHSKNKTPQVAPSLEDPEEEKSFNPDDWKDITPVPQFSDKVKLLRIQYSKNETQLMDIFRGCVLSGEISPRVYNLTSAVIQEFPTNYMAWAVRMKCLDNMTKDELYQELNWLNGMIVENQKNYQIWHYRKLLIDKLNDASMEKKVLNFVFKDEEKNFHAWSHRIWMIRRFDNTEDEFDFIEKMLKKDIKNNSVWNYRNFLVLYMNGNKPEKGVIDQEIRYAIEKIKKYPINECPFSYIRGFIIKGGYKYKDFEYVKEEIEKLECLEKNRFALSLLLDYYEEEGNEKKFNDTIEKLIEKDFIRKKYYLWRKENAKFK